MRKCFLSCVWLSTFCLVAGCSSDSSSSKVTGGDGGGDAAPSTSTVSGLVSTFAAGNNETPLAGAEICVLDEPAIPCATSNADGTFTLAGIPTDVPSAIVVTATDHVTAIIPAVVPAGTHPTANIDMVANSIGAAIAPTVGIDWPLGATGQITFYAKSATVPHGYVDGASVSLASGTAKVIVYAAADESLDLTRTATSTAGWGVMGNVAPGTSTLSYSHTTLDCSQTIWGWPNNSGGFDVPVRAGALTFALAWCG